jgi:hypothetical protein
LNSRMIGANCIYGTSFTRKGFVMLHVSSIGPSTMLYKDPHNDEFESLVDRALGAEHCVQIWNLSDKVLRTAFERADVARSPQNLRSWIRARLSEWEPEVCEQANSSPPEWPRGIAFPLAGANGGQIGFVAASESANFPKSEAPMLAEELAPVFQLMERLLEIKSPTPAIWVPQPAEGKSAGLAVVVASLANALEVSGRGGIPRLLMPYSAFTGAVDVADRVLRPVDVKTLPQKLWAAARCGFKEFWVADGQAIHDEDVPPQMTIHKLPLKLADALGKVLQHWIDFHSSITEHFSELESICERLGVRFDWVEQCVPGVIARLATDPADFPYIKRELNILDPEAPDEIRPKEALERPADATDAPEGRLERGPTESCQSAPQSWRRLIELHLNREAAGRDRRLIELCHLMLERHANNQVNSDLIRLAVYLSQTKLGAFPADKALDEVDRLLASPQDSSGYSLWLHLQLIAGGVQRNGKNREIFLERLTERPEPCLTSLAIVAAKRLYRANAESLDTLRRWIRERMGSRNSRDLPADAPLKARASVQCRSDFRTLFGQSDPGGWASQLRGDVVRVCKYPVCNSEYEWFDPAHERNCFASADDSPVVGVSWYQAYNFAFWAGLQLPTRAEWLSAAVPPGWNFGWQFEEFSPRVATYRALSTTTINHRPGVRSYCGCHEMSGNVWEWVLDWSPSRPPEGDHPGRRSLECRMALGGAWTSPLDDLNLTQSAALEPATTRSDLGFRCVEITT